MRLDSTFAEQHSTSERAQELCTQAQHCLEALVLAIGRYVSYEDQRMSIILRSGASAGDVEVGLSPALLRQLQLAADLFGEAMEPFHLASALHGTVAGVGGRCSSMPLPPHL
jgi:hypothetical protein